MSLTDPISHVLQVSVAPAALISGVGLLTLCATNRMTHLLDRLRSLCQSGRAPQAEQLAVLIRRAYLLRLVLISFLLSILAAVLVVTGLFVGEVLGIAVARGVTGLFVLSLTLLAAGLVGFALEASYNLAAVQLELESLA